MKHLVTIVCVGLVGGLFAGERTAWAWEQSQTCYDALMDCQEGLEPLPTAWEKPCISIYLNENGTSQMPFDTVHSIVESAVLAWNHPDVSSLGMHFSGLTNETRVGYNPYTSRNANIIIFRDDAWHEDPSIMALTSVTYRNSSGQIYDADMEINTYLYEFGVVSPRNERDVIDLQNTITHELGHVAGLDHSDVSTATMYPYSTGGVTYMQTLDADDLEAIGTIYPPGDAASCQFHDAYFEKPDCDMDKPCGSDGVCSVKMHQGAKKPFLALAIVLFALILTSVIRRYVARTP